jgi:hypothetical protein
VVEERVLRSKRVEDPRVRRQFVEYEVQILAAERPMIGHPPLQPGAALKIALSALAISGAMVATFVLVGYAAGVRFEISP